MQKCMLLTRANIRKAKGQTVAIVALVLLATVLLNLWLMLAFDYKQNFVRGHDRLNAEDVSFAFGLDGAEFGDFLSDTVEADARTDTYELTPAMINAGTIDYHGGTLTTAFVFLREHEASEKTIGQYELVEDSGRDGIYIPVLFRDDYAVGDTFSVEITGKTFSYPVAGYYNNLMVGSFNTGMCGLILSDDYYEQLAQKQAVFPGTFLSVRLHERAECGDYESTVYDTVTAAYPMWEAVSNSYELVSQSRYVSYTICVAILAAMAFIVTVIALIVIASNVANYIQENLDSFGTLKALGYTSRQLVAALLVQFSGIAAAAFAVGIGGSYLLFPVLNEMMMAQTGIPYELHFLPVPALVSLAVILGTVVLTVLASAARLRRIEPIVALRQGIVTHNFKRNHAPLERSPLSVHVMLAWKTMCANAKQSIAVCVTMLAVALVLVFSGTMWANMLADSTALINLVVGEVCDSAVNVTVTHEKELLALLDVDARVEKRVLYTDRRVQHEGGEELHATLIDCAEFLSNQSVIYEGNMPRYANEIAVAGKYAKEYGIRIGDEIIMSVNGSKGRYLVCGFTQLSNQLGKDCLMTREAMERLVPELDMVCYYINLTEGTDIDAFNKEIEENCAGVEYTINADSAVRGSVAVYLSIMKLIVVFILMLSALVILFVLYLLVRSLLNKKKQDYGILKALGYTTGQLVLQTALSFMPVMVAATAAGLVLSMFAINPLLSVFMSSIGIVKCTFHIPFSFLVVGGIGVVALAFGFACLLSVRIRKIAPRALLAGE